MSELIYIEYKTDNIVCTTCVKLNEYKTFSNLQYVKLMDHVVLFDKIDTITIDPRHTNSLIPLHTTMIITPSGGHETHLSVSLSSAAFYINKTFEPKTGDTVIETKKAEHQDHEIVTNLVLHKEFKYCRQCKVEVL